MNPIIIRQLRGRRRDPWARPRTVAGRVSVSTSSDGPAASRVADNRTPSSESRVRVGRAA
eukprot:159337-Hanusia_phi.AAC.1